MTMTLPFRRPRRSARTSSTALPSPSERSASTMSGRALSSNGNASRMLDATPNHLKVGHVAEQARQRVTHDIVVINDQYSDHGSPRIYPAPWVPTNVDAAPGNVKWGAKDFLSRE